MIWKKSDIQNVNNILLIKGEEILSYCREEKCIHKACYSLPSKPEDMDEWCNTWLEKDGIKKLQSYLSN